MVWRGLHFSMPREGVAVPAGERPPPPQSGREQEPGIALPRGLAPLGYRNFALYWLGQAGSNTGTWMEQMASAWVLYQLTDSPFLLGLLGVFRAVPFLLVAPIAGAAADRLDQRRVLLVAQIGALMNSLVLGLLVLAGLVEPWHMYLQGFLQTTVAAVDSTARQALFPRLVAPRHIPQAVTLNSAAARTSGLVGPAIGGLLIVAFGNAAPFLANAASYLVLFATLLMMRNLPVIRTVAGTSLGADIVQGLRYVAASPLVLGVVRLEAVVAIFSHNPAILTIVARDVLGLGADGLGRLLSAVALGALVGNAALVWRGDVHRKGLLLLGGGAAYAAALLVFAWAPGFEVAFAALIMAGLANSMFSIMRNTVVQVASPPAMRGRAMASLVAVTRGLHPLAQTQSGLLAGLLGPTAALTVASAGVGGAVLLMALRNESLRRFVGIGEEHLLGKVAGAELAASRATVSDAGVGRPSGGHAA